MGEDTDDSESSLPEAEAAEEAETGELLERNVAKVETLDDGTPIKQQGKATQRNALVTRGFFL